VRGEQTGRLPVGIGQSAFGPRLQAAIATLAVRNRVSRRDSVELCQELFGARISSGTVDAILTRAGDALEQPHLDLARRIRRSRALNIDETGWRLKGARRALWGVFTDKLALYRIAPDRHEREARELLAGHTGVVTSDRWWAYNHLSNARRQICWAHLRRDFQAHAEGLATEREFGQAGLEVCRELFWAWEIYQHTGERRELQRRVRLLRRQLKPILRKFAGTAPRYKYTRGMARNLLKVWPAEIQVSAGNAAGVPESSTGGELRRRRSTKPDRLFCRLRTAIARAMVRLRRSHPRDPQADRVGCGARPARNHLRGARRGQDLLDQ
jgi:transposase